jgi:hypothetical protein
MESINGKASSPKSSYLCPFNIHLSNSDFLLIYEIRYTIFSMNLLNKRRLQTTEEYLVKHTYKSDTLYFVVQSVKCFL